MRLGIAADGSPFDPGAARIAEAEQAGGLVEGLARRIVDRAAEPLEFEWRLHMKERGVTAAGDEADAGIDPAGAMREPAGVEVGRDVVVAHDRDLQGRREPLGGRESDQQRADEPRRDGHGDGLELRLGDAGSRHRLVDHRDDAFDVGPRRHLRHDPAPPRMELILTGDDTRQHHAVAGDDGCGRLVARGFNRKQRHA